jgi:hexosaminidase
MYRRLGVLSIRLEELGLTHEKNQAMMLRRLAGGAYPPALETLASVVEPVKEYRRYQQRPQTMLSPLTGLIDAARPDSAAARGFSRRVNLLLSDAPRFSLHFSTLRDTLTSWRDAGPVLETLIDRSPALAEGRPLARDLSAAGTIGLEALSYIQQGVAPTSEWRDARLAALAEIEKPKAALEFPFITALRELVHAAHEQTALRDTAPADWRKRVRELASPPKPKAAGQDSH